jgi:hypothetical protein
VLVLETREIDPASLGAVNHVAAHQGRRDAVEEMLG